MLLLGTPVLGNAVLVVGDSLSAGYGVARERGWVALLERRLAGRDQGWTVVNASISGDTTSGGVMRLPAAMEANNPQVVILELGGNDGLRGQPLALIRANLATMIELCRRRGARVLLLGMRIPPNYGPVYTSGFEAVFESLHEHYDVAFVPFFLDGIALDPQLMQDDGIHPTEAAQPGMLDTIWGALEPLVEQVENDA